MPETSNGVTDNRDPTPELLRLIEKAFEAAYRVDGRTVSVKLEKEDKC